FQDRRVAGTVEVPGDDLLGLIGVEIFQIGLRRGTGVVAVDVLVDYRHVRLRAKTDRRVDQIEIGLRLADLETRLVTPGETHVAHAFLNERGGRAACTRI